VPAVDHFGHNHRAALDCADNFQQAGHTRLGIGGPFALFQAAIVACNSAIRGTPARSGQAHAQFYPFVRCGFCSMRSDPCKKKKKDKKKGSIARKTPTRCAPLPDLAVRSPPALKCALALTGPRFRARAAHSAPTAGCAKRTSLRSRCASHENSRVIAHFEIADNHARSGMRSV